MNIDHIAIWTNKLEEVKDFYVKYFNARSNSKYINQKTGFQSYFLSFDSGSRLELMAGTNILENKNDIIKNQHFGLTHIAFKVDTIEEVNQKARQLKKDGFTILRGPRKTGDGYYEFEALDPENNRIEVTTTLN